LTTNRKVLVIEDLSKTYPGGVRALLDVSLRLQAGSITSLLGPNGAGKTTLVKCIAGVVRPDRGSIRYRGQDLVKHPQVARSAIAFMFEEAEMLYGYLTVSENLTYFSYLNHRPVSPPVLQDYLTFFELDAKRDVEVFRLSRGMKQKLALLIALLKGTDLLILDEPTLGLDVASRRQMIEFLRRLRDEHGKTILLTTHDMALAQAVSDHYAFIRRGQVVWSGTEGELAARLREEFPTAAPSSSLEEAFLHLTGG